jgi:hypothetical protein
MGGNKFLFEVACSSMHGCIKKKSSEEQNTDMQQDYSGVSPGPSNVLLRHQTRQRYYGQAHNHAGILHVL